MERPSGHHSQNMDAAPGNLKLVIYLIVSVLLMSIDQQGNYLKKAREIGQQMVQPVYLLVNSPARFGRWLSSYASTRKELNQHIYDQQKQLQIYQAKNNRTKALEDENTRLRQLMGGLKAIQHDYLLTEILNVRLAQGLHGMVIDKGLDHGVVEGQVVVDGDGIVGQVIRPASETSFVMMITDPNHGVPVIISRTGLHGIAYGNGDPSQLTMPNIPVAADVREGDRIVASGFGGRFPSGYPVGVVTGLLRPEGSAFAIIELSPFSSMSESTHLLLIRSEEAQP